MKIKRASLCQGQGQFAHNLRLFTANNVDKTRTKDNIVFVNISQQEMYERLFSGAVSEYNATPRRKYRQGEIMKNHVRGFKGIRTSYTPFVA